MESIVPTAAQMLETLRRRRAELRESMNALEQALPHPPPAASTRGRSGFTSPG